MTTYSYSIDEEHFTGEFETPEDAAITGFNKVPEINVIFVGIKKKYTVDDFIDIGFLLESIANEAYEECGGSALDWLEKIQGSKAKREELKKLISDWLKINAPVKFFAVDDVMEYAREDYGLDDDDDDGAAYD
jgi:hypothetical protein